MRRASFVFVIAMVACGDAARAPDTTSSAAPPTQPAQRAPQAPPPTPPTASDGDASAPDAGAPLWLVLSAFPAEQAPILADAKITSMQTIAGKTFRIGTLGGARVALGLVGMGLPSATMTSHAAIAALSPAGVVFSGTAGSKTLRIGDVVVPTSWALKTTATYAPDAKWLAIAKGLAPCFEQCTEVPATGMAVCMDHVPGLLVGGDGQSDDTSVPVSCKTGNDDVFGCDVGAPQGAAHMCAAAGTIASAGSDPIETDNETAAVAAEAAARGIPFIAFRGMSDGGGDPLGLPGYPTEFFAYYRLAARNAAAATKAFLARL